MKRALVYDRVNKIGGAEQVLKVLHQIYPNSPLYTAVYNPKKAIWAKGWDVRPSFVNKFPKARSNHELYPWLMPLAFESFDFNPYDVVISTTSAEAKGILTKPNTLHLCYCLTPTRYLWKDYQVYKNQIPKYLKPFSKPAFSYLKNWDKVASSRPDVYIAISNTVKKRIKKYYQRDAEVIYPPVNVNKFQNSNNSDNQVKQKNYFLIVSRLVAYKNIKLAIKACNQLKENLVIVGKGVQMEKLKKISGPTINFVKELTEGELVLYYLSCRAFLSPQEEDFGISIVEAQAAGKPVIAYNKGGASETIIDGKTGIFFAQQSTTALINAIKRFEKIKFSESECRKNSQRFSKIRFINEFSEKVKELWQKHKQKFQ